MAAAAFQILPCASAGVHAVAATSRHVFPRHSHEQFGIGTIVSGGQRWHSGLRQVEAGAGAAIAVNPGEVHDGEPVGGGSRSWRMLYFEPSVLQDAAAEVFGGRTGQFEICSPAIEDRETAAAARRLYDAETSGAAAMRREELLLALAERIGRIGRAPVAGLSAPTAAAKARMDDDPAAPVTLGELARLSDLSRFQLLRSFAREIGLTPHAYLIQRRVDLVRRLIARGTPIAEAAVGAGFADQSHLTRTFVRRYGLTPGRYARACGKAGGIAA